MFDDDVVEVVFMNLWVGEYVLSKFVVYLNFDILYGSKVYFCIVYVVLRIMILIVD